MEKTLQLGSRRTGLYEQQEGQIYMLWKQNKDCVCVYVRAISVQSFLTGGWGYVLETMYSS